MRKEKITAENLYSGNDISPEIEALIEKKLARLEAKLLATQVELKSVKRSVARLEKENLKFRTLLIEVAEFLSATTSNSNWPSSVTSSPLMESGRILFAKIKVALGNSPSGLYTADRHKEEPPSKTPPPDDKTPRKPRYAGAKQPIYPPDEERDVIPVECPHCHGRHLVPLSYYVHQLLELPEFKVWCLHFHVWSCKCSDCGKKVTAEIPPEYATGFGPRFTAMLAELSGGIGVTRRNIEDWIRTVFKVSISQGAIEKCLQRATEAIQPFYNAAKFEARHARFNHVDETSWRQFGSPGKAKHWVWCMCCKKIALFMIMKTRSSQSFADLIGDWRGILIPVDYKTYVKWAGKDRQTCLAHLIRRAKSLSESLDPGIAKDGVWILA